MLTLQILHPLTIQISSLLTLTDRGLWARDSLVAEACARHRVPLVGVLGGGYSKDARAVAKRHTFLVEAMQEMA